MSAVTMTPSTPSNASPHRAALDIIVVLYKSRSAVAKLWQCLACQEMRNWRLIVIDNSPSDGGGQELAAHLDPRLVVIANTRNEGFGKAVNQGLRIALGQGAQRCLLLNPDVTFPPLFLSDLLTQWNSTRAQVIAPRIMYTDDPNEAFYAGGGFDHSWRFETVHFPYDPQDNTPRHVEFASGCCLGIEAAVLRRIGLLDESFFVYWEDCDFSLRLNAAAIPILYVPQPVLLHDGGASTGGDMHSPVKLRLLHQSQAVMMRKHFGFWGALRDAWRTFAQEWHHRKSRPGQWRIVAMALASGFLRRRKPIPPAPSA